MRKTCTKCSAEVVWARSTKGKWMPVDVLPVLTGLRFTLSKEDPPVAYSTVIGLGFKSHFATCPYADQFRKEDASDAQEELF